MNIDLRITLDGEKCEARSDSAAFVLNWPALFALVPVKGRDLPFAMGEAAFNFRRGYAAKAAEDGCHFCAPFSPDQFDPKLAQDFLCFVLMRAHAAVRGEGEISWKLAPWIFVDKFAVQISIAGYDRVARATRERLERLISRSEWRARKLTVLTLSGFHFLVMILIFGGALAYAAATGRGPGRFGDD